MLKPFGGSVINIIATSSLATLIFNSLEVIPLSDTILMSFGLFPYEKPSKGLNHFTNNRIKFKQSRTVFQQRKQTLNHNCLKLGILNCI